MLDATLEAHLKILGKLAYAYNSASTQESDQKNAMNSFFEQVAVASASDEVFSNLVLFAPYASQWNNAITNGPEGLQTLAKNMAGEYLRSDSFYSDLGVTYLPSTRSVSAIVNAFARELSATASQAFTSGGTLVSFLSSLATLASGVAWPTSAGAGITHADGTFVTVSEVA